jgi:AcrR family transcriptional regulator
MPDRRRRRQERTRAQILEVARGLVRDEGFDRVSLRRVAEAADYSPASLYEYFDGKEALLTALAHQASARLAKRLRDAVARTLDEPLVAVGLAYVRYAREVPEDFQLMFSRATRWPSPDPGASPELTAVLAEIVGAALAEGRIALGGFERTEHLTYALWALVHGMATLQLTLPAQPGVDYDAADGAALRAFLRGLEA